MWVSRHANVCPETELIAIEASATVCDDARHGLPPRLMAHQPTRFTAAQEPKPSPSPGIRITRPDIAPSCRWVGRAGSGPWWPPKHGRGWLAPDGWARPGRGCGWRTHGAASGPRP